ncbi:hypothetical protein CPB84DRAFT_1780821 [Gymnopilus junonius]|uniref:Uncharacterized protein n=1 Tax=Gymnopilus junonius TaxID=109634 RepID=A0A9P5TLD5_GYMJU|nr:hypothetical protein CPB84DRAFT_1780821 [Gymnopilus junonius]
MASQSEDNLHIQAPIQFAAEAEDAKAKEGHKLLQILKNDPLRDVHPLALQVRSLDMSFSDETRTFSWIGAASLWRNTLHRSLPAILDILQNLHAFQLKFEQSMDWNTIGSFLQTSLVRLFASPKLTRVSINKVHNFRPEILRCPNLRDLRLDSVWVKSFFITERRSSSFACTPPALPWAAQSFQSLHNFDARFSDDVLKRIRCTQEKGLLDSPFSRLRNYTIYMPMDGDILNHWWAMKRASQTLECLTVDQEVPCHSDSYNHFPGPICLSDFISLRTLVLKVSALPNDPLSALHHLTFLLNPDRYEPTTVRSLILNVNFPTNMDSISARATSDLIFSQDNATPLWKSIENALLGPAFPCLQKVQFTFKWMSSNIEDNSTENDAKSTNVKEEMDVMECICGRMDTALPKVVCSEIEFEADWKVCNAY